MEDDVADCVLCEAQLLETIKHYSNFPATGVSLRQMVQFGSNPSTGRITTELQDDETRDTRHETREKGSVLSFWAL